MPVISLGAYGCSWAGPIYLDKTQGARKMTRTARLGSLLAAACLWAGCGGQVDSLDSAEAPDVSISAAEVSISIDDAGTLAIDYGELSNVSDPVRLTVSTPSGDYTVHAENLPDAANQLYELSLEAYSNLPDPDLMEKQPLITPEQLAALSPEERADFDDKLARVRKAMALMRSPEEMAKLSSEERAEIVAKARKLIQEGDPK